MTDNIVLNPGFGGDVVAADDVNGVQHQLVKVEYGDADSATQVSRGNPLPVRIEETGSIATAFFGYLKENGTGSTEVTASAGLGSEAYFIFGPSSGSSDVYRVSSLIGTLQVSGGLEAQDYGNITGSLTNGLQLQIMTGSGETWGTSQDLTSDAPIRNNIDWARYCYDIQFFTALGAGDEFMLFKWSFEKSGAPLRLEGNKAEALVLVARDDLSSLSGHKFSVQGIIETQLT